MATPRKTEDPEVALGFALAVVATLAAWPVEPFWLAISVAAGIFFGFWLLALWAIRADAEEAKKFDQFDTQQQAEDYYHDEGL